MRRNCEMTPPYEAQDEDKGQTEGLEALLNSMQGIQRGIDRIGSQIKENYGMLKEILEAVDHREPENWHEMYDADEGFY